MRKKVTIKGVDIDAWFALKQIKDDEQRLLGAIVSDAILEYHDHHYGDEEEFVATNVA